MSAIRLEPDPALDAAFYEAVGRCITSWADIEVRLLLILINCLHTEQVASVAAAYYSAVAFAGKVGMVDAAMHCDLSSGSLTNEWEGLRDRCDKHARSRNHIAHYQFRHMPPERSVVEKQRNAGVETITSLPVLGPAFLNTKAALDPKLPTYTSEDLIERLGVYRQLDIDLSNFANRVRALSPHPFP